MSPESHPWDWLEQLFPAGWEWMREGFLQLGVTVLWLVEIHDSSESLRARFKNEVRSPFTRYKWLPGFNEAVVLLRKQLTEGKPEEQEPVQVVERIARVARHFARLCWTDASRRQPPTLDKETTTRHLVASIADISGETPDDWTIPESESGFVFEYGFCRDRESAWLSQARALAAWHQFEPALSDPWTARCQWLARQIKVRNETGSPGGKAARGLRWMFRQLAWAHSPEDYRLFESVRGALKKTEVKPAAVEPFDGRVVGLALPSWWPPRQLVLSGVLPLLPEDAEAWKQPADSGEQGGLDRQARDRLLKLTEEAVNQRLARLRGSVEVKPIRKDAPGGTVAPWLGSISGPIAKSSPGPQPTQVKGTDGPLSLENKLAFVRLQDKGWPGWEVISQEEMALVADEKKEQSERWKGLLRLFEAFYGRYYELKKSQQVLGQRRVELDCYASLAQSLYQRLRQAKPPLVWPVEQWELSGNLRVGYRGKDGFPSSWVVRPALAVEPPLTVLYVRSFGDEKNPPDVVVSTGSTPLPELAEWLDLPALPEMAPAVESLRQWQNWVWQVLANPQEREHREKAAREKFKEALGEPGRFKWFTEKVVVPAVANPESAEGRWLKVLLLGNWCECYPRPDLSVQPALCHWPCDAPLDGSGIKLLVVEGEQKQRLFALGEKVSRFAQSAEAEVNLSFVVEGEIGKRLVRVQKLLSSRQELFRLLWPGWNLLLKTLAVSLGLGRLQTPREGKKDLASLLERLGEASQRQADQEILMKVLAELSECLRQPPWRVELMPSELSVLGQPWTQVRKPGLAPVAVAGEQAHQGRVMHVERFGYRALEPGRESEGINARLAVCVGPLLPILDNLREILGECLWPPLPMLRARFEECAGRLLADGTAFEDSFLQLYRDFHTEVAQSVLERIYSSDFKATTVQETEARKSSDGLAVVMRALGLEEFRPKSRWDEQPDPAKEVEIVGVYGNRLGGVVQPGWKRNGEVCVQARARYDP